MKFNRIAAIMIVVLSITSVGTPTNAANKVKTTGIFVDTPSQNQIIQFVKSHPILMNSNGNVTFDTIPSVVKPFGLGKVSQKHLNDGLNAINIVRYIAGIPYNVVLDDEYNTYAQAGAVVMSANKLLEHTPKQPAGMDEDFYTTGYTGTSSGNISWGHKLLSESIISGYMDDSDASNIYRMGHRRWILNPPMESTGFGYTQSKYSVMYSFDNSDGLVEDKYAVTAWPAQNTPIEYFGSNYPYTLSLSDDFDQVDRNKIKIKMTNMSDGSVYNFNSQTSSDPNSTSYFDVNNDNYGQPHCIIWRPKVSGYKNGDTYSVEMNGITKNGKSYPVSYNVSFFNVSDHSVTNNSNNVKNVPVITKYSLSQSVMTPLEDTLKIRFSCDREALYFCNVYDKNNRKVATIANGLKLSKGGNWYTSWKGTDNNKNALMSGIYRIEIYLSNSYGYSKAYSQNVQIN